MRHVIIIEDKQGVEGGVHPTCCMRALGRDYRMLSTTSMPAYELIFTACLVCGEMLA